jgi:hypothetical protein
MKTRTKKLSDETARLLRQWAMELANHLRYKEGWTADQAMRQAWLCQHALEAMGRGVVLLDFCKRDGTSRLAFATVCKGIDQRFDDYVYKGRKDEISRRYNWSFTFWDLDEHAFRSFNAARLNDYIEVKSEEL